MSCIMNVRLCIVASLWNRLSLILKRWCMYAKE